MALVRLLAAEPTNEQPVPAFAVQHSVALSWLRSSCFQLLCARPAFRFRISLLVRSFSIIYRLCCATMAMVGLGGVGRGAAVVGFSGKIETEPPKPGGFGFTSFQGLTSTQPVQSDATSDAHPLIGLGGLGRGQLLAKQKSQPSAVGGGGDAPQVDVRDEKQTATVSSPPPDGVFVPSCTICLDKTHTAKDCPKKSQVCRKCLQEGHMAQECQNELKCIRCGEDGHSAQDCPKKAKDPYVPSELSDERLFEEVPTLPVGANFERYLSQVQRQEINVQVTGREVPPAISDFAAAKLEQQLFTNVTRSEYQVPTPVQQFTIPILGAQRDLMACAQTGSGKTAAYLVPIFNRFLVHSETHEANQPLAVIMSPTRELAAQIYTQARKLTLGTEIKTQLIYGGVSVRYHLDKLKNGVDILVSTPGRLNHFVEEGIVSLSQCHVFVLDEADRMLDLGFEPVVRRLLEQTNSQRQTVMFSATFPDEIQKLATDFLNDFIMVAVGDIGSPNPDVQQTFIQLGQHEKKEKLLELIREGLEKYKDKEGECSHKALVFVERKRNADFVALMLAQEDLKATSIHGDRTQEQRESSLNQFRRGQCPILIATGVAARGLDITGVEHVLNYDLPQSIDDYVQRIGRTGRVGNPGKATSFFDPELDGGLVTALIKNLSQAQQKVPEWMLEMAGVGSGQMEKSSEDVVKLEENEWGENE